MIEPNEPADKQARKPNLSRPKEEPRRVSHQHHGFDFVSSPDHANHSFAYHVKTSTQYVGGEGEPYITGTASNGREGTQGVLE